MASDAKRALVLGVNGQDGSYLAEGLIKSGLQVHGVGRQKVARWLPSDSGLIYHALDLIDTDRFWHLLELVRPHFIFHFAAVHGPAGFFYEEHWRDVHAVNVVALHAVLEYQRRVMPGARLIYASSSKAFGENLPKKITENSPRFSECIYTTTKNAATDLIFYYRKYHHSKSSVIWTFNHESPRRAANYFFPKIIDTLAKSIVDPKYTTEISSLSFWGNWGDANEFMQIAITLSEVSIGRDFVFAAIETVWAEDLVQSLFSKFGLNWRSHLQEKSPLKGRRPPHWIVDTSALKSAGSTTPVRTAVEIAIDILNINYPSVQLKK